MIYADMETDNMRQARLSDMTKGWFVGDFERSLARSTACEVAVKHHWQATTGAPLPPSRDRNNPRRFGPGEDHGNDYVNMEVPT